MRIAQKNITLGTNESLCEETDVLDFRLTPIVRTYCSSAKSKKSIICEIITF